jgi:hypothetical protein
MALEEERRLSEGTQKGPHGRASDLAVVQVGQYDALALYHQSAVIRPVLIRSQTRASRKTHNLSVRHFGDVGVAQVLKLEAHYVHSESGYQDTRRPRNAAQRRVVEMVEMVVGKINVVGIQKFRAYFGIRRKMPPGTPIARS